MRVRLVVAATSVFVLGCENPQQPVAPTLPEQAPPEATASSSVMEIAEGKHQFGSTGQPLSSPLVVRLTAGGRPVPGERVIFKVVSGGGSVARQSSTTDANGLATSGLWTLGDTPTWQEVEARSGNLRVRFSAQACAPPGCRRLVYVSDGNIHARELTSGLTQQLTTGGRSYHPTWSPDGRKVAFARYDHQWIADIYIMNSDGTNLVRLTNGRNLSFPSWSPDGRTIAVATARLPYWGSVFLLGADGPDTPIEILQEASLPEWSPDGKTIAFVSLSGDDGYSALHVADHNGANVRVFSPRDEAAIYRPSWSPDGGSIAFPKCLAGRCDVVVMNAAGEATMRTNVGDIGSVAWSPGGEHLVVTRSRYPSAPSIAVLDPRDPARLTTIVENGSSPAWQPCATVCSP